MPLTEELSLASSARAAKLDLHNELPAGVETRRLPASSSVSGRLDEGESEAPSKNASRKAQ